MSNHFTDREARVWAAGRAHPVAPEPIPVLLVSPLETDHAALRKVLTPPKFRLLSAYSAQEAAAILRKHETPVVIAECNLQENCWKDLWSAIQRLSRRPWPRLIVAAEQPGEQLGAEVLDLGACDVLAKPFDPEEVKWCVIDGCHAWQRELELEDEPETSAARGATG